MEAHLQTEDLAVGYQGRTLIGEISLCRAAREDRHASSARTAPASRPSSRPSPGSCAHRRRRVFGRRGAARVQPQRHRPPHGHPHDRPHGASPGAHDLPRRGQQRPLSLYRKARHPDRGGQKDRGREPAPHRRGRPLPTGPSRPSATGNGSASCSPVRSASSRSSPCSTSRRAISISAISWSC